MTTWFGCYITTIEWDRKRAACKKIRFPQVLEPYMIKNEPCNYWLFYWSGTMRGPIIARGQKDWRVEQSICSLTLTRWLNFLLWFSQYNGNVKTDFFSHASLKAYRGDEWIASKSKQVALFPFINFPAEPLLCIFRWGFFFTELPNFPAKCKGI